MLPSFEVQIFVFILRGSLPVLISEIQNLSFMWFLPIILVNRWLKSKC
jgi:hypothetical protein